LPLAAGNDFVAQIHKRAGWAVSFPLLRGEMAVGDVVQQQPKDQRQRQYEQMRSIEECARLQRRKRAKVHRMGVSAITESRQINADTAHPGRRVNMNLLDPDLAVHCHVAVVLFGQHKSTDMLNAQSTVDNRPPCANASNSIICL
jgi:hypothetical protein